MSSYDVTEMEHIETKIMDGMPIEYWRGIEDALDLVSDMIYSAARDSGTVDVKLIGRKLELLTTSARDRRIVWAMRMMYVSYLERPECREEGEAAAKAGAASSP